MRCNPSLGKGKHRKRHPRGTRFEARGRTLSPDGVGTPLPHSAEKQKGRRGGVVPHSLAQLFFPAHGGYVDGFTEFGEPFTRPTAGKLPEGLILPQIPVTPGRP